MKNQPQNYPNVFGEINMGESTGTYIAKSTQGSLESNWQIKMYPTAPNTFTPVELPSQSLSSEMLLSALGDKVRVNS